jgi:hypothetical protein
MRLLWAGFVAGDSPRSLACSEMRVGLHVTTRYLIYVLSYRVFRYVRLHITSNPVTFPTNFINFQHSRFDDEYVRSKRVCW